MAASLIMRIGTPSPLAKLKPTHPLPKCFGLPTMRPLRTGAGKPMDATSNFHPRMASFSSLINCSGLIRGPDANSRRLRRDISSYARAADIDDENSSLHEATAPKNFQG
jgi:hypothetical protein